MKRAYALLMLTILLINSAAFYVFYIIELQQIRVTMREQLRTLPEGKLNKLTLSLGEYASALVEEDEIKVEGKMYDVARIVKRGHLVDVYCLHDELEDNLLLLVAELLSKPIKNQSKIPSPIFQFITLTFLTERFEYVQPQELEVAALTKYQFSLQSFVSTLEAPPPKS
jgi:hypothetical protein